MATLLFLIYCRGGFPRLGLNERLLLLQRWHVGGGALLEGVSSGLVRLAPWARQLLLEDVKLRSCPRVCSHIPSTAWGVFSQRCDGIS